MTQREKIQQAAEKRFIKLLDKAIDAAYLAGIENRGDVLTMPIRDLHYSLVFPSKVAVPPPGRGQ